MVAEEGLVWTGRLWNCYRPVEVEGVEGRGGAGRPVWSPLNVD